MFIASVMQAEPTQENVLDDTAPEKEATSRAASEQECAEINMNGIAR